MPPVPPDGSPSRRTPPILSNLNSAWSRFGPLARHGGSAAIHFGRRLLRGIADLWTPASCPACGREPDEASACGSGGLDDASEGALCEACCAEFARPPEPVCPVCAAALPGSAAAGCGYCRERDYRFVATVALGWYRGAIRDGVRRMKYGRQEALTLAVGRLLAERVLESGWAEQVDLAAPTPLGLWKRLSRGGSAPELLAEAIGRRAKMPVVTDLLRCKRRTRKQGTLLPGERLANVRDAFEAASCYDITNVRVLLVDDVMTTGATANELARALLRAGAAEVRVATVARGAGPVVAPSGKASTRTERCDGSSTFRESTDDSEP